MRSPKTILLVCVLFLAACSSKPADQTATTEPGAAPAETAAAPAGTASGGASTAGKAAPARKAAGSAAAVAPVEIPAGHAIVVRLAQTVGSKASNSGDSFSATVAQPVEVDGKVVIPQGANASGTVAEAVPLGRFKGGARLRLVLDSINVNGKDYRVQTAAAGFAEVTVDAEHDATAWLNGYLDRDCDCDCGGGCCGAAVRLPDELVTSLTLTARKPAA